MYTNRMPEFICGGDKYEVGGPKLDSIGLRVAPVGLPPTIGAEGLTLKLKGHLHVTLVAIGKIIERHGVANPNFKDTVMADFCEFVRDNPIELVRYRDEYRFMWQDERRSVVVMCDVSNLDTFYNQLNAKWGLQLEYPPTHVTLYSLDGNLGVFMVDSSDVQNFSKPIPAPVQL